MRCHLVVANKAVNASSGTRQGGSLENEDAEKELPSHHFEAVEELSFRCKRLTVELAQDCWYLYNVMWAPAAILLAFSSLSFIWCNGPTITTHLGISGVEPAEMQAP